MEDIEHLRDHELRYFKLRDQKDLIEDQEQGLRNELRDLVSDERYIGPFLTMKWQKYRGPTDWKAVVDMLVGGDAEAMDRYAEEFRKPGGKMFVVTNTPQKRKRHGHIPEIENDRRLFENQLHFEAVNDQQRRLEELKDLVAEYLEHRAEVGGIDDQLQESITRYVQDLEETFLLLVEWWQQQQDSSWPAITRGEGENN